jgi:hypothetical protein
MQLKHGADHLLPGSVTVKNEWNYISTLIMLSQCAHYFYTSTEQHSITFHMTTILIFTALRTLKSHNTTQQKWDTYTWCDQIVSGLNLFLHNVCCDFAWIMVTLLNILPCDATFSFGKWKKLHRVLVLCQACLWNPGTCWQFSFCSLLSRKGINLSAIWGTFRLSFKMLQTDQNKIHMSYFTGSDSPAFKVKFLQSV